jgi:hypothetical protein
MENIYHKVGLLTVIVGWSVVSLVVRYGTLRTNGSIPVYDLHFDSDDNTVESKSPRAIENNGRSERITM